MKPASSWNLHFRKNVLSRRLQIDSSELICTPTAVENEFLSACYHLCEAVTYREDRCRSYVLWRMPFSAVRVMLWPSTFRERKKTKECILSFRLTVEVLSDPSCGLILRPFQLNNTVGSKCQRTIRERSTWRLLRVPIHLCPLIIKGSAIRKWYLDRTNDVRASCEVAHWC